MQPSIARLLIPTLTLALGIELGWSLRPAGQVKSVVKAKPVSVPSATLPNTLQPADSAAEPKIGSSTKLTPEKLGAALMARVGKRFVGSTEGEDKLADGVTFFDTPKPMERALCRVNAFYVAPKAISGSQPAAGQEFWEDDLTITRRYATWTSPSNPEENDGKAKAACAAFRDFGNTFIDDGLYPDRGPILFDILQRMARGEFAASVPLSCVETSSPDARAKTRPCDGRAVLRRWSLKQLRQVQHNGTAKDGGGNVYWDTLLFATPSDKDTYSIDVKSWFPAAYRRSLPSDIRSVGIVIGRNCNC
ncbi:hypothetical protein BH10PSE14_BH10PSE14_27540 [soil metagenome]